MFERYTETARRIIYFARAAAAEAGGAYVEPAHFLLGVLQEDRELALRLLKSEETIAALETRLKEHRPDPGGVHAAPPVDLPLSQGSKRVLAYAAEESERGRQVHISPAHLLLGMLREEKNVAAEVLAAHGVKLEDVRQLAAAAPAGAQTAAATGRERLHQLLDQIPQDRWSDLARVLEALRGDMVSVSVSGTRGTFTFSHRTGRLGGS